MNTASWRRVLDTQMGQWRWTRSEPGYNYLVARLNQESRDLTDDSRAVIERLVRAEEPKLLGADPIFVSEEMCELVAAAADPELPDPFQPEPLYVTDLPCPNGFLWYEKAFLIPDRFSEPITLKAVSWSPILTIKEGETPESADLEAAMRRWNEGGTDWQDGAGVALTLYSEWDEGGTEEWRRLGLPTGPLAPIHFTPWHFAMSFDGNEVDENQVPTGAEWWWRIVQVTFRLMQQQLAAKHHWRSERHQRREAKRLAFPERETLVVRLRRERRGETADEHGPANYSHRFIVSGHWRNQWYPSSQEHRQLWISPYVKGDESLPLVIKPRRAMVWTK